MGSCAGCKSLHWPTELDSRLEARLLESTQFENGEQLQELYKNFRPWCTGPTPVMTKRSFKEFLGMLGGIHGHFLSDLFFEVFDADNDMTINFEEYVTALDKMFNPQLAAVKWIMSFSLLCPKYQTYVISLAQCKELLSLLLNHPEYRYTLERLQVDKSLLLSDVPLEYDVLIELEEMSSELLDQRLSLRVPLPSADSAILNRLDRISGARPYNAHINSGGDSTRRGREDPDLFLSRLPEASLHAAATIRGIIDENQHMVTETDFKTYCMGIASIRYALAGSSIPDRHQAFINDTAGQVFYSISTGVGVNATLMLTYEDFIIEIQQNRTLLALLGIERCEFRNFTSSQTKSPRLLGDHHTITRGNMFEPSDCLLPRKTGYDKPDHRILPRTVLVATRPFTSSQSIERDIDELVNLFRGLRQLVFAESLSRELADKSGILNELERLIRRYDTVGDVTLDAEAIGLAPLSATPVDYRTIYSQQASGIASALFADMDIVTPDESLQLKRRIVWDLCLLEKIMGSVFSQMEPNRPFSEVMRNRSLTHWSSQTGISPTVPISVPIANVSVHNMSDYEYREDHWSNNDRPAGVTIDFISFGHPQWNLVLSMMSGIQFACRRISWEPIRDVCLSDYRGPDEFPIRMSKSQKEYTMFYDFSPYVFRKLRRMYGWDDGTYLDSIGPNQLVSALITGNFAFVSQSASQGKSGSLFYTTSDNQLLIKTVSAREGNRLKVILQNYYEYLLANPDTLLVKFFGLHAVRTVKESGESTRRDFSTWSNLTYFVVMENILCTPHATKWIYDIKGSTVSRKSEVDSKCRKDLDWVESGVVLSLSKIDRVAILETVKKDSQFLAGLGIMDYSLLIGCTERVSQTTTNDVQHDATHALHRRDDGALLSEDDTCYYTMGIIDILTFWKSRKKLEFGVKLLVYPSGGFSCVPPNHYRDRFVAFMKQHVFQDTLEEDVESPRPATTRRVRPRGSWSPIQSHDDPPQSALRSRCNDTYSTTMSSAGAASHYQDSVMLVSRSRRKKMPLEEGGDTWRLEFF